jgi:hypothetical protein
VSVYSSINAAGERGEPSAVDERGTIVDVAIGIGDVRLGVWLDGEWAPCAYLTPDQACDVAMALIEAALVNRERL